MPLNVPRLKSQMVLKGYTNDKLSKQLGISNSAFSKKLTQKVEFSRIEIEQLIDILEIDDPCEFFFKAKVS